MIIAGYAGIGKTTLAKKYPNKIIDLESSDYNWIFSEQYKQLNDEERKGLNKSSIHKQINNEYPQNYIDDIIKFNEQNKIILISCQSFTIDMQQLLVNQGQSFLLAYPTKNLLDTYISRFKKRGNNDDFISRMVDTWVDGIEICKHNKLPIEHILLEDSNDTLELKLIECGYL